MIQVLMWLAIQATALANQVQPLRQQDYEQPEFRKAHTWSGRFYNTYDAIGAENSPEPDSCDGAYFRIVLLGFRQGTSKDSIRALQKEFTKLGEQLPEVQDFQWGQHSIQEPYTHVIMLRFKDREAMLAYESSATHQAVVKRFMPIIGQVLPMDYYLCQPVSK